MTFLDLAKLTDEEKITLTIRPDVCLGNVILTMRKDDYKINFVLAYNGIFSGNFTFDDLVAYYIQDGLNYLRNAIREDDRV